MSENLHQLVAKYESESQHEWAVQLCKKTLRDLKYERGNDYPDKEKLLNLLAQTYLNQINYSEIQIGPYHRRFAVALLKLGDLYSVLKKFEDAESVYRRSLLITQKVCGESDSEVVIALRKLARACQNQDKGDEADLCLKDALKITEIINLKVAKREETTRET